MKNKHAIKYGLLAGIGTVFFLCLLYWIDKKLYLNPYLIWSTLIFYLIAMYKAAIEVKKDNRGYLPFKAALKATFLVYVIANALYYGFNYVLYNFLDPEMLSIQIEYIQENKHQLEHIGLSEEQKSDFENTLEASDFGFFTMLSNYFGKLIGGFILALILSMLLKIEPPKTIEEELT